MGMSNIETLATFKALESARLTNNTDLANMVLGTPDGEKYFKRVQFETHPAFIERLDSVCGLLDVSKREFLEAAVSDAMDRAQLQFETVFKEATGQEFGERQ